ncbi:hypothetical protein [Anthocerotibacter panamensis]|uniref:hypothetical protein n=1 Tax=Anthocerotibacter panamensis TaxID=2857077 RepID=UPI001C405556|nr:hypothetical protein [Anthocerotibacter panamensis]
MGSPKHFLFYNGANEIAQNTTITRKKATLLATQGTYVDSNCWIEKFFCGNDGDLWILIRQFTDGTTSIALAQREDWKRTTQTTNPDVPNPSVSEFTYYMSRRAHLKS